MRTLGRVALVGLVWLTAFSTLAAGFPHLSCRCPGGRVKPCCLGLSSKTTPCCCGGACCSAAEGAGCCCRTPQASSAEDREAASCCHGGSDGVATPADGGSGVGPSGCMKALATPVAVAVGEKESGAARKQLAHFRSPSYEVSSLPTVGPRPVDWQVHTPAPLADLVTVLRRLLI